MTTHKVISKRVGVSPRLCEQNAAFRNDIYLFNAGSQFRLCKKLGFAF